MAIVNDRSPMPKNLKIKNTSFIQLYKRQNPHCEVCILDGVLNPATDLHHLVPGIGRTDEIWNVIHLCQKHHTDATIHIKGNSGILFNYTLFTLKLLKLEITEEKLINLGIFDQVKIIKPGLEEKWKAYVKGELLK
jgi:hypothetical protein